MIENLNYKAEDGVIIEYDIHNKHKEILFSDINPYWNYATEDDFEGGRVYVFGTYIAFSMLVASDQGGVIVVWDTEKECLIHISEAAYCKAFCIYNDKIYYLCDIWNYVTPSHIRLFSIPLHTMDSWETGERIFCQSPCQIYNRIKPYNTADIEVSDSGITVKFDNKEIKYSDSIDTEDLTKQNMDFEWLYDTFNEEKLDKNNNVDKAKAFGWLT